MATRQELTSTFFALKERKEKLNEEIKSINENLDSIEKQLVVMMENENLQSFKDNDLGTIFLREEVYAKIENEDQAFQWLVQNGMKDVIKQSVNAKTLSAIIKERGEFDGTKATYITRIGFRRNKDAANSAA